MWENSFSCLNKKHMPFLESSCILPFFMSCLSDVSHLIYNKFLNFGVFTQKLDFSAFSQNLPLKKATCNLMMPFRLVSSNVSNCIVLKFVLSKFQLSSSIKQGSYWYLNMGHLLWITLYNTELFL